MFDIIITTFNSERTLKLCLDSINQQSIGAKIIIVDFGSTDSTVAVATSNGAEVIISPGTHGSFRKNLGAAASNNEYLGFVDSDMYLEPNVLKEVIDQLQIPGVSGVAVPEVSIGTTYWAMVRQFERSFYIGEKSPQAARFVSRELFNMSDRFDERLISMEDFPFDLSIRKYGKILNTKSKILHDEGNATFLGLCKKKFGYKQGIQEFVKYYGKKSFKDFIINREYFLKPYKLFRSPKYGVGVIVLKIGELISVLLGMVIKNK